MQDETHVQKNHCFLVQKQVDRKTSPLHRRKPMDLSTFKNRVIETAQLIGLTERSLSRILKDNGIDDSEIGFRLLNAKTTSIEYLEECIRKGTESKNIPELKIKAAASILKGNDPFAEDEKPTQEKSTINVESSADIATALASAMQANRDPHQMKDRELLQRFIDEREYEVEQELHRRAKFQPFIVLKPGKNKPGQEQIDIESTLDLLKTARKRTNPTMIPLDGKVVPVYRITELNPEDRITEICPICGEGLYKGYCPKCELDFAGVGDEERAYVALVSKKESFNPNNFSDRKAVHASAIKGLEDLKITWPSIQKEFEDLKLTNSLPQIRVVKAMPSEKKIADPFNVNGNRTF